MIMCREAAVKSNGLRDSSGDSNIEMGLAFASAVHKIERLKFDIWVGDQVAVKTPGCAKM
ncbi:hypothetical protein N7462_006628 [Penicillium macrosclerotiorum]|uniref:uncharacterized protein n=1 Tax=Penicillium macrosclerotiorum TaxID=303699 RepID=UPI0025474460|nr:uncharacterized protein N7462_006628 [Penicillium macrosclerotiorum]KAJ5683463.1 hypothetical protein N7462_006628 [Penicillium macrosclerotiorum]